MQGWGFVYLHPLLSSLHRLHTFWLAIPTFLMLYFLVSISRMYRPLATCWYLFFMSVTTTTKTDCEMEGSWGYIYTEISPKAASGKAQMNMSENKYIFFEDDLFWTVTLSLLASIGNRYHFWYTSYLPCTYAAVLHQNR